MAELGGIGKYHPRGYASLLKGGNSPNLPRVGALLLENPVQDSGMGTTSFLRHNFSGIIAPQSPTSSSELERALKTKKTFMTLLAESELK